MLANITGIPVVSDFRCADIASGGQGAPFASLYHQALAKHAGALLPMVVLNIGGVANVTYIGPDEELLAFDTGPGNAPIDDLMMKRLGEPMDRDGVLAEKGIVHQDAVMQMLSHPYFSLPPPKSLDRFDFTNDFVSGLSLEDAVATLTAFTVLSIVRATEHFPSHERGWLIAGGGRHNLSMMKSLRGVLRAPVLPVEKAGWRGDFLEAEAFGYLAVRSARNWPLSLPCTTGVSKPMSGGHLYQPA
jgi:anhydro-N-acetylmuramic acid kinase